jgi:hypothetical protein
MKAKLMKISLYSNAISAGDKKKTPARGGR